MSMSLKTLMVEDAISTFLNSDEFAEAVIYQPRSAEARTIVAMVTRGDIQGRDETDHGVEQMLTVTVARHATLGILPTEIDTGDAMFVSWKEGETVDTDNPAHKHMLAPPVGQDAGTITFRFGPR